MADTSRRGMSPVLAFILGVLFAFIVLAGAIAGGVYFALTYKLDNIGANKDEDGNYIYINADPDNGGVANVLDLVKKLGELTSDSSSLTLGGVEGLIPYTSSLTSDLYTALGQYMDIDEQEIKQVKFSELGQYFEDKVMDIRPARLLESFGGGLPDNKLIEVLLYGKEADYVEEDGGRYPVWYDVYEQSENTFRRKGDRYILPQEQVEYLSLDGGEYRLYYYRTQSARSAGCFITVKGEDGKFTANATQNFAYVSVDGLSSLTGNYYYQGEEKVETDPVTLGSLTDGSAMSSLDGLYLTDFIEEGGELTDKIIGGITIGSIIDGSVDFGGIVNGLTLDDLIDVTISASLPDPSCSVLAYVVYGITDLTVASGTASGREYTHTGVYNATDGVKSDCYIFAPEGKVEEAFIISDGAVTDVKGTTVNGINDRVSGVTRDLKIGQLMDVSGNKFLEAVGNSTVASLPADIQKLSVNQLYAQDIYEKEDGEVKLKLAAEYNGKYLYYELADGEYRLVNAESDRAGKLTEAQFESGVYYTYGKTVPVWKLLLYASDGVSEAECAYSINNLTSLITNVTTNTRKSTLRELYDAEILYFENESVLEWNIRYEGREMFLGKLTLEQTIDFFVKIMKNPSILLPQSGLN